MIISIFINIFGTLELEKAAAYLDEKNAALEKEIKTEEGTRKNKVSF